MSDTLDVRPLVKYHKSLATVPMALVTYCPSISQPSCSCGHACVSLYSDLGGSHTLPSCACGACRWMRWEPQGHSAPLSPSSRAREPLTPEDHLLWRPRAILGDSGSVGVRLGGLWERGWNLSGTHHPAFPPLLTSSCMYSKS